MNHVLEEIYSRIVEISDKDIQRKMWLNENNDIGLISSFDELMCSLFDDFDFDKFVDYRAKELGILDSVILELKILRDMLNNYQEKESHIEIIEDEEWENVSLQARKIVKIWKG